MWQARLSRQVSLVAWLGVVIGQPAFGCNNSPSRSMTYVLSLFERQTMKGTLIFIVALAAFSVSAQTTTTTTNQPASEPSPKVAQVAPVPDVNPKSKTDMNQISLLDGTLAEENPRPVLEVSLSGSFRYGPVDGFFQTPQGGNPGSSSHRRPTLDELDIDDATCYDVLASVQWRQLWLYAGYHPMKLNGQAVLSESLVSQNVSFPAGTDVRSENDVNWLSVGGGWKFEFADRRLEIIPKAEFAYLDLNYRLSGGGQTVDREYINGCVRLGLETRYRFNRVISVSLDAGASLPISDWPQIAALTGTIEFALWPEKRRVRPKLFLGGGMQRIDYEDTQELPNHFQVDFGPFVTTGLAISF